MGPSRWREVGASWGPGGLLADCVRSPAKLSLAVAPRVAGFPTSVEQWARRAAQERQILAKDFKWTRQASLQNPDARHHDQ